MWISDVLSSLCCFGYLIIYPSMLLHNLLIMGVVSCVWILSGLSIRTYNFTYKPCSTATIVLYNCVVTSLSDADLSFCRPVVSTTNFLRCLTVQWKEAEAIQTMPAIAQRLKRQSRYSSFELQLIQGRSKSFSKGGAVKIRGWIFRYFINIIANIITIFLFALGIYLLTYNNKWIKVDFNTRVDFNSDENIHLFPATQHD